MAEDLSGLAIVAGLLLPALAAAVWAIRLERRPRRVPAAVPAAEPDSTVAGIQARLRFEHATDRTGPVALLRAPIPEQPGGEIAQDRLPWRLPRTLPPPGPATERLPVIRFAFAPPDSVLMRRILDGLHELD
jgi:hypothetical protein